MATSTDTLGSVVNVPGKGSLLTGLELLLRSDDNDEYEEGSGSGAAE